MNWDQIEGKWKELRGRFGDKWAKLTDDDLMTDLGHLMFSSNGSANHTRWWSHDITDGRAQNRRVELRVE